MGKQAEYIEKVEEFNSGLEIIEKVEEKAFHSQSKPQEEDEIV
jgi:hypothetical protein